MCYIKCYKRWTKYAYPLFWLPSNRFTWFFINTLLCVAMVAMWVKNISQNVSLSAAYCHEVYMNRTMFTLIAFDYLILTFKVKRSGKIPDFSWKFDFLSFVSMVTAQESETLLSPIGYRQIVWAYINTSRKINYTS